MKAMNPEFQIILDEGEALKGQLISGLNKHNKSSFKVSLTAWFNSVINQTPGISYYGFDSLDSIIEHAEFYLESLAPKEVISQIDRVIGMIASIPPTRARVSSVQPPYLEKQLSVNLKLHDLIALCDAAARPPRKPWDRFRKHLSELERTQSSEEEVSRIVSQMTYDLFNNSDDQLDDTEIQEHETVEAYRRLKSALEERAFCLAKLVSRITLLIPAILIITGAIGLIWGHPFHGGLTNILIGIAGIAFVLMELLGNMQHIAHWRSKLESLILPRLRRALGAEESLKPHVPSVLGLDSTVRDNQKHV